MLGAASNGIIAKCVSCSAELYALHVIMSDVPAACATACSTSHAKSDIEAIFVIADTS